MSLRGISLPESHVPVGPVAPSARSELFWMAIERLAVDEEYQRPLSEKNWRAIRRIVQNFTWAHFSPCIVAWRAGEDCFALVDGQHRVHAALMAGHREVPCLQISVVGAAEEARAFAAVNGAITAMTPYHILRAAIAGGEEWALRSLAAVEKGGGRLLTYPKSSAERQPGEVFSVQLVKGLILNRRDRIVTDVVAALLVSPSGERRDTWTDAILRPVMTLADRRSIERRDLFGFLATCNVLTLAIGADRLREQPKYARTSRSTLFGMALEAAYDRWQEGAR